MADPDQYAPRHGGFCAGGMSLGRQAAIDPEAWVIVDGKLFLGGSSNAIDFFTSAETAGAPRPTPTGSTSARPSRL